MFMRYSSDAVGHRTGRKAASTPAVDPNSSDDEMDVDAPPTDTPSELQHVDETPGPDGDADDEPDSDIESEDLNDSDEEGAEAEKEPEEGGVDENEGEDDEEILDFTEYDAL